MIEKKFIKNKKKELKLKEFLAEELDNAGLSKAEMHVNPTGVKITIHSSMSGLVVGRKGSNIKKLQKNLKKEFDFDNLRIEVKDVKDARLDAQVMAEKIAYQLFRQGKTRFKAIGHGTINQMMEAGARGAEVLISGKVPGKRSRNWRFYRGYLPKCGHVSDSEVDEGYSIAKLKPGIVGITVKILQSDVKMPDDVTVPEPEEPVERERIQVVKEKEEKKKEEKEKGEEKKKPKKKKKEKPKKKKKEKKKKGEKKKEGKEGGDE